MKMLKDTSQKVLRKYSWNLSAKKLNEILQQLFAI